MTLKSFLNMMAKLKFSDIKTIQISTYNENNNSMHHVKFWGKNLHPINSSYKSEVTLSLPVLTVNFQSLDRVEWYINKQS